MLYNQPLSVRFGTELVRQIESTWSSIDIAVAWARASGMAYLIEPLEKHLRSGGRLSAIVGVDLQNTTYEGLLALLELEKFGDAETFVYHNEAGSTFHPKLYLFRSAAEARLIVGSNNLTQSGLYVNVEAGLQIDAPVASRVVADALDALASWKDTSTGLVHRLNHDVLDDLQAKGYVPDEKRAVEESKQRQKERDSKGAPLFSSRSYRPPPLSTGGTSRSGRRSGTPAGSAGTHATGTGPAAPGTTLLMRLRKAHKRDRPTQTQIPIAVLDTFFHGTEAVRSLHSGEEHVASIATARGGRRNTIKLEIPEMRDFEDPVARFEQTPAGITYEVYDASSAQGKQIMTALELGLRDGTTSSTLPNDLDRATFWRFI